MKIFQTLPTALDDMVNNWMFISKSGGIFLIKYFDKMKINGEKLQINKRWFVSIYLL
jgi:hypothetical protein